MPALAIAVSAIVMTGWWSGLAALTTLLPGAPEMKFNAAVLVVLLALAIILVARDGDTTRRRAVLASWVAAVVVIFGGATVAEHVMGVDLGIDGLFFREPAPAAGDLAPGRMSVPAALAFMLLGLVVFARARGARESTLLRAITVIPATIAVATLFSYLFGVDHFFDSQPYSQTSLPTASLLLLLAMELLVTGDARSPFALIRRAGTHAAYTIRRALVVTITAVSILGLARLVASRAGWVGLEFGLALHTTLIALGILALLLWLGGHLDASERRLAAVNAELEQRVAYRTRELEAKTLALADANRELEAFAYAVAHDLRTPLRSLDGISRILVEDCGPTLDAEHYDYLQRIRSAAQKMGVLIDALLRLSREAIVELKPGVVDLEAIATKIVAELRASDPDRLVETAVASGIAVRGDAQLLEQLLRNLLENAWKFTGKAEHPRIEVGVADRDGQRAFFVRDNGAGFDPSFGDRMFTAFQRLHRSDEFPGTGIGLTSVQRIARRHGGSVWAEGAIGQGATFYFTLGGNIRDAEAAPAR